MLRLNRRRGLAAAAATVTALALGACGGLTESTNTGEGAVEDLKIIVPADAGGGWDSTGRAMAKVLEDKDLVSSTQVVNVPGAGGTVGLAELANEKNPDTLMMMGLVMLGSQETNNAQVTLADTTPIARLTDESEIIVVPANSPYKTINDLVEDIKKNGKDVAITGGSAGGTDHLVAALMVKAAGMPAEEIPQKLNYIPYSGGGSSLGPLLGGKYDAGISGVSEYLGPIKRGELRALAVTGEKPVEALPDVPTLTDAGIDLVLTNWRGVVAPGNIDDAQRDELTELVTDMHGTEEWQTVLESNNWDDAFMPGQEFGSYLEAEGETVTQTLKDVGLVR